VFEKYYMKPIISKNLTPLPYLSLTLSYKEREAEKLLLAGMGSPLAGERCGEGVSFIKNFSNIL
jgi:hypothetical protein